MKQILMASTLLVLGMTQAQAQTPQPADWVTLTLTADIAKPADVAWERIGGNDWCAIAKYLEVKGCVINSGKGELGSVRTIVTATANLVENVVARTSRSYTYAQPFSSTFYHGTMAIEPVDADHSRLVYSFIWNQAALPDQKARTDAYEGRKVRFQAAMDKMKATAEAP